MIVSTPTIRLNGQPVKEFSLVQEINRGWTWKATLPGIAGDPESIAGAIWIAQCSDGRGWSRTSPPLRASLDVEISIGPDGIYTALQGSCHTSWLLGQPLQSLPTFRRTTANAILEQISAASGVPVVAPDLGIPVWDEDLKLTNWWDPLARIAEIACCSIIVDQVGHVRLIPCDQVGEECRFKCSSLKYSYKADQRVTGFVVSKKTAHHSTTTPDDRIYVFDSIGHKVQQLRSPISYPVPFDRSSNGACYSIGFWDKDPGGPGAGLLNYFDMGIGGAFLTVPFSGINPARYMTLDVYPPTPPYDSQPILAKVYISGSTLPEDTPTEGLDLGFTVVVGSVAGPGARPGDVRAEPLYPSAAWVTARADRLLWEANKGSIPVQAEGPIDCSAVLAGKLVPDIDVSIATIPAARIERIEERWTLEGVYSQISGPRVDD